MQRRDRERAHFERSGDIDWGASVSLDAERRVLGMLLARADIFDHTQGRVQAAHFYEPLHRRIFELISTNRAKGLSMTRERLAQLLSIESAYAAAGGHAYLDQLATAATISEMEGIDAADLCRTVWDLHIRRECIAAASDIMRDAKKEGIVSGSDLRAMLERRIFAADFVGSSDRLKTIDEITTAALTNSRLGGADLLSLGFRKVDDRLGKCERGDFGLIAARPAMGKSALAACIAKAAAKEGLGVIELNGEMSEGQIARRHLADQCHEMFGGLSPTSREIRSGRLSEKQRDMLAQAKAVLDPLPVVAMRKPGMSVSELSALCRRQKREWSERGIQLGFVIVDHLGILGEDSDGRFQTQTQLVTRISKACKRLAVELECVLIGLSQLNRDVEKRDDKRPQLHDLRDSGTLEQDADWVMAMYRDAYYAEREGKPKKKDEQLEWQIRKESHWLECLALKVREGAPGVDKLWCDVARNAIRDDEPAAPGGLLDYAASDEEILG